MHTVDVLVQVAHLAKGHGASVDWALEGLLLRVDTEMSVEFAEVCEYFLASGAALGKEIPLHVFQLAGVNQRQNFAIRLGFLIAFILLLP